MDAAAGRASEGGGAAARASDGGPGTGRASDGGPSTGRAGAPVSPADAGPALSARDVLALEAAKLAHGRGLSQQRISEILHVSRPQVSKLLATARAKGFVRTRVLDPRESDRALTRSLCERFDLARVRLVVPAGRGPSDLDHALGLGAAELLDADGIAQDATIALWWSDAVRETLRALLVHLGVRPRALVRLDGQEDAAPRDPAFEAFAASAALALHRTPHPVVHPSLRARLAREDAQEARAIGELAHGADALLLGIDPPDPSLLAGPVLPAEVERGQIERSAVGRICGRFLDAEGRIVAPLLSQRTSGPTLTALRRTRRTVLVAGGAQRTAAIRAALARRYANHLVTDVATARRLLAHEDAGARTDED